MLVHASAGGDATEGRRLIINADDFGLSEGVNRGILEAHRAGVVTSTSLLANAPAFADAAGAARAAPELGIGVHLNLTAGRPVSLPEMVPSLCDSGGRFHSLPRLIGRALARRVHGSDVATECRAQIERCRAAGLRITHLDGHQHAHALPGILKSVLGATRQAGIELVRIPRDPLAGIIWRPMAAVAQALLGASYALAARGVPAPRYADHFRGFALTGRPDFRERLLALLDTLEPGVTELMVHPGYADASLSEWVSYAAGRERELAALTSHAVRARLARGDIELVHFGHL